MARSFFNESRMGSAIYRGASCNALECATGRLRFAEEHTINGRPNEAVIAVAYSEELLIGLLCDALATVGAILIGDMPSRMLIKEAERLGIPLLYLPSLSKRHNGKLAILDTERASLFVDPDIDTLNKYAQSFGAGASFGDTMALPISHLEIKREDSEQTVGAMHLCTAGKFGEMRTEDELFDDYRELCENEKGLKITFLLCPAFPVTGSSGERFATHLRAIFRAAVYGKCELLCGGPCASTVKGAALCLDIAERVRGTVTSARMAREYNADIPCGLMISTPLNLCLLEKLPKFDYFCLELESLVRLFGSCTAESAIKNGAAKESCRVINRIIFEKRKKAPISCAALSRENIEFFAGRDILHEGIESFFVRI